MNTETFFPRDSVWPRVAWGIFLLSTIALFAITADTRVAITFILLAALMIALAWRFPYAMLSAWMPLSFLLGIQVIVSTGYYRIGERSFGTTLELSIGEVIAVGLLVAWALRMLLLWRGRRDHHWQPILPLALPFAALAFAHLLSYFGPGQPALGEVLRFVARYQLFVYLSCIALVVNFVRSKKRLRQVLLSMTVLGAFFAVDGLRNMVVINSGGVSLQQAQPMPILEVNPLGGNQHALAETLIVSMGCALALAALTNTNSKRRTWILGAAALMFVTSILTFSRTAWIVLAIQGVILAATVWRDDIKRYGRELTYAAFAGIPFAIVMVIYSLTRGALGSLDARSALTGIAWTMFQGSPWVGVGAGTFANRVAGTYAFVADFGMALDSHGIFQKVAAEAGLIGLAALAWVLFAIAQYGYRAWKRLPPGRSETSAYVILVVTAFGAFLYQTTSTSYWTPRLWVSVGLMLAAGQLFTSREVVREPDFLRPSND